MSSNNEVEEQKKRSNAIDKVIDEDSKKLRRECKILLLGTSSDTAKTQTSFFA
jgi:guanine nucleotide-binding protein G(i) subunit alpha